MSAAREFMVGVFSFPAPRARDGVKLTAYTTWYNPTWDGCCEHVVQAATGEEAKRAAMEEHRQRCLPKP
jgi:hypothetical protein